MAKILKIDNGIVSIGNDDGTLTEIRTEDCNYNPNVGDEVNLYTSEGKTICVKAEVKPQPQPQPQTQLEEAIKGGININVTQNQGSNNTCVAEAYDTPMPAGGKKAVSKLPYVLLAFFLGGLGIHKFYAGKMGEGVLYLLFCWTYIPGIIAFVEAIIACCQKEDANGRILV